MVGFEHARGDAVEDDPVHLLLLFVALGDVTRPAVGLHAADLGGGDERLLAPKHVEPQQRFDHRVEAIGGIVPGIEFGGAASLQQLRHHNGRQTDQQSLLGRVVVVEPRHRQPGPRRDVTDRSPVIALLDERLQRRSERFR